MGDDTLSYSDLERFFLREGLRFMASHPVQELKLLIRKTLLYWGPAEISSNKVEYLEKRSSPVLRFLPSWPVAAALFFTGVALFAARMRGRGWPELRRDPRWLLLVLLLLFVAVSFATHLVFFVTARFRVPVVPFMLLFGAYALHALFGFVRRNESSQLLRWGAALVFLLALAHINVAGYRYEPDRWHFQRGASYGVIGDIDRALAELHAAVAAGTTIPAIPSELGFAYAYKGDFASAEKWYREALKLDPRHAETLNKLSYALLQLGRPQEALEVAKQASEADFTASGPWLNRASALFALERPQEAEEALKQALVINPGEADACLRLADLYIQQQRFAEAIAQLEALVRLRPNSPEAHNYLGYEYARAGRYEEAEAAYRRAIALNVDFTLAYNNLGNLYAQQGRYDEAVVQFSEVVRVNGHDPYVHYSWAWVELQRGRLDLALEHINYHLEINPEQVEGINLAGEIALKRGEVGKALEYFRKAIVLNVAYAPARINLGQVLEGQGAVAEALEQYEVALKYDPGNAAAVQAVQRLRPGRF
jgi:tetratricopeptide (TPR) repeat protein